MAENQPLMFQNHQDARRHLTASGFEVDGSPYPWRVRGVTLERAFLARHGSQVSVSIGSVTYSPGSVGYAALTKHSKPANRRPG